MLPLLSSYRWWGRQWSLQRPRGLLLPRTQRAFSATVEWPVDRVRSTFIDYFKEKHQHEFIKSSPVIPYKDNTIMFANAGMNQFKGVFTGTIEPAHPFANLSRAVNSQKCIRAGGKHNDLSDVGKDVYHHTFFEMLGTWSFGNYFKEDAIGWAYDILINVYKLPKDRIYVSYFAGDSSLSLPCDTEARDLWLQYLPADRVLPFGAKANFWEMGDTGPCGPCSEIHFDRIGNRDAAHLVNMDDPDVLEIWNLVFMQFNRDSDGSLKPLPAKHVDTGMGLERLTSVLQRKSSNYDTDVFGDLFKRIHEIVGGKPYFGLIGASDASNGYRDMGYRVLADHARTVTFAIADGAIPSSEGRGYVLRRILRRAFRYSRQNLSGPSTLLSDLVSVVVDNFKDMYPELQSSLPRITAIISEEEESFSVLLERGIKYFEDNIAAGGRKCVTGEQMFFLYDTMGFPPDLTELMAQEKGMSIDMDAFLAAMEQQKERSREAESIRRSKLLNRGGGGGFVELIFTGDHVDQLSKSNVPLTLDHHKYSVIKAGLPHPTILKLLTSQGDLVDECELSDTESMIGLILSETPFYSEGGGQIADTGTIKVLGGTEMVTLQVIDTQSLGGYVLHTCYHSKALQNSLISCGSPVEPLVNQERRQKIAPNHTMTHLLNHALRLVCKEKIQQKGSLVTDEKLRFDFTSSRPLSSQDLINVEKLVNGMIDQKIKVYTSIVPLASAMKIKGIQAVFGESYPDPVRIVAVGVPIEDVLLDNENPKWESFSIELCGGTHVPQLDLADAFVIVEEGGISKGVRRITAVTGNSAIDALRVSDSIALTSRTFKSKVDTLAQENEVNELDLRNRIQKLRQIEGDLDSFKKFFDSAVIPLVKKQIFRAELEKSSIQLRKLLDKLTLSYTDKSLQILLETVSDKKRFFVENIELPNSIGISTPVVKRVMEEVRRRNEDVSFMIIFSVTDSTTVSCYASVAEGHESKLDAVKWMNNTVKEFGGKCGGRQSSAQGNVTISRNVSLDKICQAAYNFEGLGSLDY